MRRNYALLRCAFCALAATTLLAQVVITSTILGTVTDPQGAVLPQSKITLTNVDTGVQWKATTSANGDYQFHNLIAGHYKVEVVKEGFAHAVSTVLSLENGTTQRVNLALTLGQATETVEVTSAAALVKTDDANVSEVIENKFVRDLPVEGRNYLNFAQILPNFNTGSGDTSRLAWGLASATTSGGAMQLNVGGTEYGVGYYIDGLDNNDNWVEGPITNVNQDTIQEIKAEVSNYSAEYGRDVGQISVTSKSGTNVLHGSVYDTFQNAGLNANDAYSNIQGIPRSAYHQNQYGFTVGGPVYIPRVFNGKNKLFFFASFERLRNRGVHQFTTYVPSTAERTGDFSEWLTRFPGNARYVIYDPTTYDSSTGLRQPFANNVIPNPNPNALAYLSHFPSPNGYSSPNPGLFDNYSGNTIAGIDNNNYTARADYNLSSRDTVYFRYSRDTGTKLSQGGLVPELSLGNGPLHRVSTYQAHYVHAFSSTFSNEMNVSWTRAENHSNDPAQANTFAKGWIQGLFQNTSTGFEGFTSYDKSLLGISQDATFSVNLFNDGSNANGNGGIGNINDIGSGLSLGSTEYWYQAIPIFQFSDNVAKTTGRHNLKAGFYLAHRYERDNDVIRSVNFQGNYTSSGLNTGDGSGNGIADFETGFVSDMNQRAPVSNGDASLYFGMPEYGLYLNDSWNATPRLTVSMGLRYDLPIPAYSVNNYWGVLDQNPFTLNGVQDLGWRMVMPGLTPGTSARPFPADKKDLGPRLGLAYRLDAKTVIRSGYGIFYESGRYKYLDQMFFNSPGYGGVTYSSGSITGDSGMTYYTLPNSSSPSDRWSFPAATTVTRGEWPIALGTAAGTLNADSDTRTVDSQSWKTTYIQRWSLDVQRELGKAVVATLGYVGSRGTHLPIQYDLNLPQQGTYFNFYGDFLAARPLSSVAPDRWSSINTVRSIRSNNYHAMNAELKTRGWHGVTSQVSYTWSKQMDDFFGEGGESGTHALGGQWHPEWSYGPSDADHTHRFVAAFTYELPGKSIGNRVVREFLGGWQVNSITTFESGAPTSVYNGYTSSYDYMGDVPDRTCNGNLARGSRTFTHYFNTDCYVEPAASTDPFYLNQGITNFAVHRGSERRNNLKGPGINNWDMGLQKSFRGLGEGRELQFRAEAFNAFNHTQWSSINTFDDRIPSGSQSQFGYVTGARPGRHMQLNMKFVF